MATKYTRVKDRATGHEYDVLSHKVDNAKHELVDPKRYPEVSRPRAAKPNVKSKRPSETTTSETKTSPARRRSASAAKKPAPTTETAAPGDGKPADTSDGTPS